MGNKKLAAIFFAAVATLTLGAQYDYEKTKQTVEAKVIKLDDETPVLGSLFNEATIKLETKAGDTFYTYNHPPYFVDRKMTTSEINKKLEVGKTYTFNLIGYSRFSFNITNVH